MVVDKQKLTKLIAVALSASAIAFFSFKLYNTVKQVQSDMKEAEDIQIEMEVRRLFKEEEKRKALIDEDVEEEEVPDDTLVIEHYKRIINRDYTPIQLEEEEIEEPYIDGSEESEVEKLRFSPDSVEALNQYKNMMLAEFDPRSGSRQVLEQLFEIRFVPTEVEDQSIKDYIVDNRINFFGFDCVWNEFVTIADLLLHFGRMLDFDLDRGVEYWTNSLLGNLNILPGIGAATLDNTVTNLVRHTFVTQYGYGMFCLSDEQYQELLRVSSRSGINFLKQYHIFLEGELGDE